MKSETLDFQEIFGASTVRESLGRTLPTQRPLPELPMDADPLWEIRDVPAGAADGLVKRFELAEFIDGIVGEDCAYFAKAPAPAPSAGIEFLKRARGLTRQDIAAHMSKFYTHGLWKRWERMMDGMIGDAEFDEKKALSFLQEAA